MKGDLTKLFADLEFDKIKGFAAEYCTTSSAKEQILEGTLYSNYKALLFDLNCTNEYVDGLNNIALPALQSEEVLDVIQLLNIENATLNEEQFMRLRHLSSQVNYLIKFLVEQEELFLQIRNRVKLVYYTDELIQPISEVLDRKGQVKNNASAQLASLRRKIGETRKQIEVNFNRERQKYRGAGFLDGTKESFLNGRKVLAVQAEFKRKVNGSIIGSSNGGKLAFIEPQANVALNNELGFLEQEERDEIQRILKALTTEARQHINLVRAYQELLVDLDVLQAKAHFAQSINGKLPQITKTKTIELIDAYHPLLLIENKKKGDPTYPQSLRLNQNERIMVISGPNAGGKSITLKTMGLLQVMLQSGYLIPAKDFSTMHFFSTILTDIGDKQSIENHLSTYSYKLKNMGHFLNTADAKTLFLIDEFGSGSDPDLGGALAEVFFETLYHQGTFGVITTHYSNIKVLADRLPEAFNACMLFDRQSLKPLFQLSLGQPGSSFTFEVAELNNIPKELINRAKQRVQHGKLKLDDSIAALQKEKAMLDTYREELKQAQRQAEEKQEEHEIRKEEFEFKIMRVQQTQKEHNQLITLGNRLKQWLDQFNGKNHRKLSQEFVKFLKIEFTKKQEAEKVNVKKVKPRKQLKPIDAQVKKAHRAGKARQVKTRSIKAGDQVRIAGAHEKGEVLSIKKQEAVVAFGNMRTTIALAKLEPIEA